MASHKGLELRWPFFNLQLVKFAFASPDRIRLRGKTNKFVHRGAMQGFLPADVLKRTTKADFMVTYRTYLAGMGPLFNEEILKRRERWINTPKVLKSYEQTQPGPTLDGMPEWQLWGLFGCDAICMYDNAYGEKF